MKDTLYCTKHYISANTCTFVLEHIDLIRKEVRLSNKETSKIVVKVTA